ncbi:thioredoxin domain-containing protein [Dehalococcoidia bacterium]|nr:thioredoxin domain-containing protein [Dehalococcoidia bacterium]
MPNRLIHETSPYLLQHAHNPVDWHSWGEEAFAMARERDVPVLLSVGYSSCHWCHVMERESFENPDIAALMNQLFVSIKVDREERPDVDSIYMAAVQAMTGQGGWPMTVFLTPDGDPFYGGTYFPPDDRRGLPAFPRVMQSISDAYRSNPSEVKRVTGQLVEHIRLSGSGTPSRDPLTEKILDGAFRIVRGNFDDIHGGVGMQPKFPQPMTYEFLLRYHARSGDPEALEMVQLTLDQMAEGGIYDQIGGGFHRYSTDAFWLVPHFEKMLYDNALLAKLYLHAYQVTGDDRYRQIVEQTLEYVRREMTSPEGGFYSAQDADSEGVEGKFFVWRPEEIISVLGKDRARIVNRYFGVTQVGNFEGKSILHRSAAVHQVADETGLSQEEFSDFIKDASRELLEARQERIAPERDDKVLTAWNGMMLRAYAEAGAVLGRADYVEVARRCASFLLDVMRRDDRLLRTYRNGEAKLNAYLDDYACLIDGLISLHEADMDFRWLREVEALANDMVALFWDDATGQFYDTGNDHEKLIVRPRGVSDNAVPCGLSMAADTLLRLAVITGNSEFESKAVASLQSSRDVMARIPMGAGHWLGALEFYLSKPKEVAIIGGPLYSDTQALVEQVYRPFIPNRVLVVATPDDVEESGYPLLSGRTMVDGKAAAYLCENYVCRLPLTDSSELAAQLAT